MPCYLCTATQSCITFTGKGAVTEQVRQELLVSGLRLQAPIAAPAWLDAVPAWLSTVPGWLH